MGYDDLSIIPCTWMKSMGQLEGEWFDDEEKKEGAF